jgi:hypothetical protein
VTVDTRRRRRMAIDKRRRQVVPIQKSDSEVERVERKYGRMNSSSRSSNKYCSKEVWKDEQ